MKSTLITITADSDIELMLKKKAFEKINELKKEDFSKLTLLINSKKALQYLINNWNLIKKFV